MFEVSGRLRSHASSLSLPLPATIPNCPDRLANSQSLDNLNEIGTFDANLFWTGLYTPTLVWLVFLILAVLRLKVTPRGGRDGRDGSNSNTPSPFRTASHGSSIGRIRAGPPRPPLERGRQAFSTARG